MFKVCFCKHICIIYVLVNGFKAYCVKYDIAKNPVSVHHPLWRFLSGLFSASPKILSNYFIDLKIKNYLALNDKESEENDEEHVLKFNLNGFKIIFMEMPLRLIF